MSDTQELRPPKSMYTHVVDIGASKAVISPFRTFLMGFYSGCHIAFGAALALGVGIFFIHAYANYIIMVMFQTTYTRIFVYYPELSYINE